MKRRNGSNLEKEQDVIEIKSAGLIHKRRKNKEAATRFRRKEREFITSLENEVVGLEKQQCELMESLEELKKQQIELKERNLQLKMMVKKNGKSGLVNEFNQLLSNYDKTLNNKDFTIKQNNNEDAWKLKSSSKLESNLVQQQQQCTNLNNTILQNNNNTKQNNNIFIEENSPELELNINFNELENSIIEELLDEDLTIDDQVFTIQDNTLSSNQFNNMNLVDDQRFNLKNDVQTPKEFAILPLSLIMFTLLNSLQLEVLTHFSTWIFVQLLSQKVNLMTVLINKQQEKIKSNLMDLNSQKQLVSLMLAHKQNQGMYTYHPSVD